ncbi:MAG: TonB-dependent receptor plug domain-containing protein [Bacteroidia bacterium]
MNKRLYSLLFVLLLSLACFKSLAQADSVKTISDLTIVTGDSTKKDSVNYYDMSLEQLLSLRGHNLPTELEKLVNSLISVASKKPLSVRESPSIVSLITADEIKAMGARDLMDVLRMVPGIDFGVDVLGVTGLGMRGNWAHEGKVLVLIDGQEMNEILFGTTQWGNHYPIDQIKKIEIIRGPGSAIYGGYAEYGVINIITKQGEDINGVTVSGIYGQGQTDFMRRNVNVSAGEKKGDFQWSMSSMIGEGQRSDAYYKDIYGDSVRLRGKSQLNPAYVNFGASYKGFSFRGIGDFYHTTTIDGNDAVLAHPFTQNFNSMYYELKYVWKINNKLTITPKLNYKNQSPWATPDGDSTNASYIKTATRTTGNITASYSPTRKINIVAGGEYYRDLAIDNLAGDTFYNGKNSVNFYNYAFFTQGLVKTRLVNIILGARYDKHNVYGDAFVPRVGFTKKINRFHFKALYSNSFRAPSIENINLSLASGILPERTQVGEVELGYQLTHNSILTVNLFDITTKNPIVYYFDANSQMDVYQNQKSTGTSGIEAEYRLKTDFGSIGFNYSYYTAKGKSQIAAYHVADDSSKLLGFASHKFNLNLLFNFTENLSFNITASFYGARYGYTKVDTGLVPVIEKFEPVALINMFLNYKTPVKGLTVGAGVYDLKNERYKYIQPYSNASTPGHAPLPGPGREFVFKLSYDLNFKPRKE